MRGGSAQKLGKRCAGQRFRVLNHAAQELYVLFSSRNLIFVGGWPDKTQRGLLFVRQANETATKSTHTGTNLWKTSANQAASHTNMFMKQVEVV